jgi:hypothetical protein
MQFLLLIYSAEATFAKMNPQDVTAMVEEYGKFTQEIMKSGHYKGGERLRPIAAATTVRVRDGKRVTTDGPFAETKEQLAGFYMIDANDLDEAIAVAARIPGARDGSIEVRPIFAREALADSAKG